MKEVKFAAFVIPNLRPFPKLNCPFQFDASTFVQRGPIKDILEPQDNKIWKEWLGSIYWESNIEHSSTHLITWKDSAAVDVLDQENQDLESKLYALYHALILTGPFRAVGEASILSGKAIIEIGHIMLKSIRQVSRPKLWISRSYYKDKNFNWMSMDLVNPTWFDKWKENWIAYDAILAAQSQNFLVELAQMSFREGCHQQWSDFRFPNFVRSIETIIALRKGLGAADFSSRTQSLLPVGYTFQFAVTPSQLDQILKESYQLRSDCVHGKPFADTLQAQLGANFKLEIPKYEYVIETCARLVLQRALKDSKILGVSNTRSNLEGAWNKGYLP